MSENPVLEMRGIRKSYYGNEVLKGIDIEINRGEIQAVVGENGAGKSTLMNILFGMPVIKNTGGYKGEILLDGEKLKASSPREAMKAGIGMVHQEFMLLPGFTITENIKLNREITGPNMISKLFGEKLQSLDYPSMNADARKALDKLGLAVEETSLISGLPVSYMQFVEIAREIDKDRMKVLVFDEPTAALTEEDAETLLEVMEGIVKDGISIIFISHRLNEVMKAADKITVIRDGEMVGSKKRKNTSIPELAELMVGREVQRVKKEISPDDLKKKPAIMKINNLRVEMPGEEVKGFNLTIKEGEILGIGGLAGHGKIGVANGIMGLYESSGEVYFKGNKITLNRPTKSLKNGLAFVSEDRRGVGLLMNESIERNIGLTAMQIQEKFLKEPGGFKFIKLEDRKGLSEHAKKLIDELDIRCNGPEQVVQHLSGGNQQKVCIARAITLEPDLLFVSEPTRGIDVGAKKIVLDLLVKLNQKEGMTIVITSSELAELKMISDRIAITYDGKLAGILNPDSSDVDFGLLMAGELANKGVY
ncbi:MAG: sugar ABC transporter ATP-binding protein [Halanaerobiales bacterium]